MAFNFHSALKPSMKMNEAKIDFQLPKISSKGEEMKKKYVRWGGSTANVDHDTSTRLY